MLFVDWEGRWIATDLEDRRAALPSFLDVATDDETLANFTRAAFDADSSISVVISRPAMTFPRPAPEA